MNSFRIASRRHLKQAPSLHLRTLKSNVTPSLNRLCSCSGQERLQSSLSSFNEAEASLFHGKRFSKVEDTDVDVDKQLRADVKSMGTMLGKTIKHYAGEDVFNTIEELRMAAKVRK